VTSGCSAVDVPMTSYGAPDEHPMSTRSASDERRWKNRGWKYVAMIFVVLVMSVGQVWGDQTWDFTEMSSADKTAYDALTSAWTWNTSNKRYDNAFTPTNGTWTDVISTTITQIKDMKFMRSNSNMGTANIRIFPNTSGNKDGRLAYGNSNVAFSIPAEKDDEIKITFSNTNSSAQGYVLTNAKRKSDNATTITVAQNKTTTETLVVTTSGRVEFKCDNSKVILYKLVLTSGGEECAAAPSNPSGFSAGTITSTGATFTITDGANTNNYEIYYSTSNTEPTGSTGATATTTDKTKVVTGLSSGATYYAWVRAVCDATHKSDWVALGSGSFTTLTTPTATFSNNTYAIGGSALDLSSLWTSNSDGAVTFSVDSAGTTGASVSTAAFSATTAGYAKVKAVQAANGSYDAITKYAYIQVGSTEMGSHTITYNLNVNVNSTALQHCPSVIPTSLYLEPSKTIGTNGSGGPLSSGQSAQSSETQKFFIDNSTSTYTSSNYVYYTFTVADGYTFEPTSVAVKFQSVSGLCNFHYELTDGVNTISKDFAATTSKGATPEDVVWSGSGTTLSGTVTLKVFAYKQADEATAYRFGTPITITGTVAEEVASGCSAFSFHTGGSDVWNTHEDDQCFELIDEGTKEWRIDDYTRPNHTHYVVNWQGGKYSNGGDKSATFASHSWADMSLALARAAKVGVSAYGVEGSLRIYANSSEENLYVGFIPTGYVVRRGGDNIPMEGTTSSLTETVWLSDLQQIISSNAASALSVGLKTTSSSADYSQTKSVRQIFFQPTSNWKDASAEFYIYYWGTEEGWGDDKMIDPDGDGIYEGWIPATGTTKIEFVRENPNGAGKPSWSEGVKWASTGNVSLDATKNLYVMTGADWEVTGEWRQYSPHGKYRIWVDNVKKNFHLHFYPHYAITYDANGGSSAPAAQSVAADGNSAARTVAVAAGSGMTAPAGYYFYGWNPNKSQADAGTKDDSYDPSDNVTLSADVTLYAVWRPILVTAISVDPSSETLNVGGTVTLSATATPATALDKTVTWSTSDEGVASVTSEGVVTAVAPGTATITATANDGSGITATCAITVNKITPSTYAFSADNTSICSGSDVTFTIAGSHVGATYYVTQSSSGGSAIGDSKEGTGSALSFTVSSATTGDYYCFTTETTNYQAKKVSSSKVTISYKTATSISSQPNGIADATVGVEQTLSVTAAGTNLEYQWKVSDTENGTYSNVASEGTSASYSVTPAAAGTKWYQVVVTGDCGEVTSDKVSIVAAAAKITPTVTWTTVPSTVYKGGKYAIEVSTNTDASLVVGNLTCTNGTLSGVAVSDGVFTGYLEIATNASSAPTLTLTTSAGSTYAAKTETNDDIELGSCEGGGGSTIYSYTITSTSDVTGGSATGGSVDINGLDDGATAIDEVDYYKIGGDFSLSKRYIKITLSGTTLAAGDVITLFDAVTSDDKGTFILYDSEGEVRYTYGNISTKNVVTEQKYTITAGDGLEGSSVFYIGRNGSNGRIRTITITRPGGGSSQTTNLTWSGGLVDEGPVDKTVGDANFTYTASSNNSNGAISYSSGTTSVATINSSTGEVTIVSAGSTTITATIAESGCYPTKSITYTLTVTATCTPVDAPTGLTCSAHTSSSLTFTWTKADHASTYTATLYSNAGCTSEVESQELGNVATVTFSTLSAETTYYCQVQSQGDGSTYCADGGTTAAQSGTTDAASLTAIEENTLYQPLNMLCTGMSPLSSGDTYFTDDAYSTDNRFYYDVSSGNGPKAHTISEVTLGSGQAYEATFTSEMWVKGTSTVTDGIPSAPSIKFLTPSTSGTLYLYIENGSCPVKFKKEDGTASNITGLTQVVSGKIYSTTVEANSVYYIYGNGESNTGVYGLKLITCSTPAAPTAFSAGNITSSGVTFSITDAGNAASYDIYYSTSSTDPTSGTAATTTSESKTKAITGLEAETEYYAWVRAVCDASHKSDWVALDDDSFTTLAAGATPIVNWAISTGVSTWTATPTNNDATNLTNVATSTDNADIQTGTSTGKSCKLSLSSSATPDKYVTFTFKVACGKKLTPSGIWMEVANVGGSSDGKMTHKAELSDTYGHSISATVTPASDGVLNELEISNDEEVYFQGVVTLKVWAWNSSTGGDGSAFRMGPNVKIFGTIGTEATPTATITWTKQPAGGLSGTNETVTAVSSDGSAVTITSNNGSVATVAGSTVSYVGVGSTYLTASGTDACGNTMVSVNSDNFTVIGAYNLSYDANTGTGTMTGETGVHYAVVKDNGFTAPSGKVFFGWNTAANGTGDSYQPGDAIELNANTTLYAQWGTALTATWSVTKVDSKLYRGGGGYSVTVYLDQADWDASGNKDDLELTATEGVTLKNIVKSINGSDKAQVTANFDITTGVDADATSITFTLFVPAAGTYASAELTDDKDLDECSGGSGSTISIFDGTTAIEKTDVDGTSYKEGVEHTDPQTGFKYTCKGVKKDLYTTSMSNSTGNGKTYSAGLRMGGNSSSSDYYIQLKVPTGYTANLYIVSGGGGGGSTLGVSKTAGTSTSYHEYANRTISSSGSYYLDEVTNLAAGTYYILGSSDKLVFGEITVTLIPAAGEGGVATTLSWETDLSTTVEKEVGDADFTHTATQDKNSLGAITYSSNNTAVATVNATTGKVHIVGAAGEATITATLAASGCFEGATVSYTINVVDNCIDEPGTITSRDLGCDGTELTVSGHTGEGAGATYQWYKVGSPDEAISGATSATYIATAAGEYYVKVTNIGTGHCAMASTNTVTVTAKAAAEATKIVDSWYVKNGRRTPDVALVQSENAESFTVKSGSTTIWESAGSTKTGFGGCGFHMDENGIIYLNGTTAADGSGNAPSGLTGGEDETLTITVNGCGGSPVGLDITIHKQDATDRKSVAFVVDGTKDGAFDADNESHSVNTALYKYLDNTASGGTGAFDLTAQNIYATTDEKAIREHYSQFDAILITDDPGTKETPSGDYKTKGYVNAFGTMVDVRPILTMEAYVSALANWKTKGIAGEPTSPNPRQYALRLECKDHEIYKAGLPNPAPGTHVWDEVIGGETYRNVVLVDHNKSPYTGLADNEETAGNKSPALQGFDGTASGSLLGLGRISNGSLQAAIERQEEPAARLLVFSIQAKALPNALTEEGKIVIKNILTYLLKTNMEEVDDCSNYFTGKFDNDWSKADNWSKTELPSSEAKVRILAECEIGEGTQVHVSQVDIVTGGTSSKLDGGTANGRLTISAGGSLIVGGKIRKAEAPHFGADDLMPMDDPSKLIINTGSTAQAALIFDNDDADTKATVNLYSLGRKQSSYQYQYFAVPMEVVPVNPTFANETHGGTGIYTYVYNEATSGWERRRYYDDLFAFEGLGITTKSTDPMNYTMTGNLASTATKEITLTHDGAGLNLIGNSWMAPIQIGALAEDNAGLDNQTVYIYCAGRDAVKGEATSGDTETAGQWLAVPFEAASFETWKAAGKLSVIPAMQAFQIKVDAEATLTLDYDKVVRGSTNDLNAKLRAPGRRMAANEVTMTNIRVADSKTHTDLSLFEGDRFSEAFDNGWEAEYMNGDGRSAKLYAETEAGQMAVAAMYDYEGTVVGFVPGQETEYTFSFMGEDNGYYLNDIKLQNSVRISEGETYTFTYEEGDAANRFYISRTAINAPEVPTGMENLDAAAPRVQKIIYNDKLYIIRGGRLYDATGKVVK